MSLAYIGPVQVDHGNPEFAWASDPTAGGVRAGSIAGLATWDQAKQLSELLANEDLVRTMRGHTGVLAYIHYTDELLRDFNGWHILEPYSFTPSQQSSLDDYTAPFSLRCSHMGSRQVVVTHSSRHLGNDFGLTGEPILVDPFRNEESDGTPDGLVVSVAGRTILREYDETSPMVWP